MRKPKLKKPSNVVDATEMFIVRKWDDDQLERQMWFTRFYNDDETIPVETPLDKAIREEHKRRTDARIARDTYNAMMFLTYGKQMPPPTYEVVGAEPCVILPFRQKEAKRG